MSSSSIAIHESSLTVPDSLPSPLVIQGPNKYLSLLSHVFLYNSLAAFNRLKVADLFPDQTQSLTTQQLAEKSGYNAARLYRLLDHLQHLGIVSVRAATEDVDETATVETSRMWRLTDDGAWLRSSHPAHFAGALSWLTSDIVRYGQSRIADVIRQSAEEYVPPTGEFALSHGGTTANMFDWLDLPEQAELHRMFDLTMSSRAMLESPVVADADPDLWQKTHTLIDIGGGLGTFAAFLVSKFSNIQRAYSADLPSVIAQANQTNTSAKYTQTATESVTFLEIDMFQIEKLVSVQSAIQTALSTHNQVTLTMKHIMHDWSNEPAIKILKNVKQIVVASVKDRSDLSSLRLLIIEHVILNADHPEAKTINWQATGVDMHMLSLFNGQQRNEPQWKWLLNAGGWKLDEIKVTRQLICIIKAQIA